MKENISIMLARITAIFAIVLLLLLVAVGCGTLDMNFDTTVEPSGIIIQKIRLEASGLMAEMLTSGDLDMNLEDEGWEVSIDFSEDSAIAVATKSFDSAHAIYMPGSEGEETILENISFTTHGSVWSKNYFFQATIPGSNTYFNELELDEEIVGELGGDFEELFAEFMEDFFSISWTITMPGDIIGSNADTFEGNLAAWDIPLGSFAEDTQMSVHSRTINWPVIVGVSIGAVVVFILLVVFLVVFLLMRRRAA